MNQERRCAEPDCLDAVRFEALSVLQEEGKSDVLGEIAALFIGEAHQWLVAARSASAAGDAAGMQRAAHGLKGLCGTIGADRLFARVASFEDAACAGRIARAGALVKFLYEELSHVESQLEPYTRRVDHDGCVGHPSKD